jgi:hypothetical protein
MKNFLGQDGFVWWIGIVENILDPLYLGRCKVRCFGYHPPKKDTSVPTEDLPWATAIHPLNTPNLYATPRVGDWVFGFFFDGLAAQEPAILGYLPAIPVESQEFFGAEPTRDTDNKLIRSFRSIVNYVESGSGFNLNNSIFWESKNRDPNGHGHFILLYDEPSFETLYLKSSKGHFLRFNHDATANQVKLYSNGGHSFELTDTENNETIKISSKQGHLIEMTDISGAEKITIKHKIGTTITIDATGNITLYSGNTVTIESDTAIISTNTLTVNSGDITFNATDTLSFNDGNATWTPSTINATFDAVNASIDALNSDIETLTDRLDTPTTATANTPSGTDTFIKSL